MKAPARRSARAIAVCLVLLGSQLFFVSTPSPATSESPCVTLTRWAQQYQGTSPSLDDIAKFDRPHRIAIFNAVSPEVRAELWRTHLSRFAEQRDLSAAQGALVREAVARVTPADYEPNTVSTGASRELWSRVQSAFTQRDHLRAWFDLGSMNEDRMAAPTSALDRLIQHFRPNAQFPGCECRFGFEMWECASLQCVSAGCEPRYGCGPEWTLACNGMCGS